MTDRYPKVGMVHGIRWLHSERQGDRALRRFSGPIRLDGGLLLAS
jgi:hypothetical protein